MGSSVPLSQGVFACRHVVDSMALDPLALLVPSNPGPPDP